MESADDAVSVLLEEGIGCKLPGLAASGTEEESVDVIGDADRGARKRPASKRGLAIIPSARPASHVSKEQR
jgi:hypothetical protein